MEYYQQNTIRCIKPTSTESQKNYIHKTAQPMLFCTPVNTRLTPLVHSYLYRFLEGFRATPHREHLSRRVAVRKEENIKSGSLKTYVKIIG